MTPLKEDHQQQQEKEKIQSNQNSPSASIDDTQYDDNQALQLRYIHTPPLLSSLTLSFDNTTAHDTNVATTTTVNNDNHHCLH
eukprot:8666909-Ditylum_brightwellii.AAC.1